ncbi:hypothetical protein EPUL_004861, partial [Erysiphe pulchra]
MFANQFSSRKRQREDAEQCIRGFREHRTKRQNLANSQQLFPNLNLITQNSYCQPSDCEISPANENSMKDSSQIRSEGCFIPQVSSQSTGTLLQSSPITPFFDSEESSPGLYTTTRNTGNSLLSDTEIYDTMHLSPESVYHDVSTTACNRISTPVYSSFTSYKRNDFFLNNTNDVKGENVFRRVNRATKIHSPISEENISPSIIVAGLNDMQMSVENSIQLNDLRKGENKMLSIQSRPGFKSMM